jgi:hypothetical protein
VEDKSRLQIIRHRTEKTSLQNSSRHSWLFFVGIAISCVGEAMLIGYVVVAYDNISNIGFSTALALLVGGNLMMLTENKLKNLANHSSKI